MKNLLVEQPRFTRQQKRAMELTGAIPVLLIMILIALLKLLINLLNKFWRIIVKATIMTSVIFFLTAFFMPVVYSPKADASQPYQDMITVSLPMKVNPDMKAREVVLSLVKIEFGEDQVESFDNLIMHESGWDPKAVNPTSNACGLGQALPCSKMKSMELSDQIAWEFDYIKNRYGTPKKAWAFWLAQKPNWY